MKSLFKFLPVVVFFLTYKYYDIFLATKVLIGLSVVSIIAYYLIYQKVDKMMLISNVLLIVFGLLTVKFQNEQFLIWKVSIIYLLLASGLVITTFVTKKSAMQVALKDELIAPDRVWRNINVSMIVFLVLCSVLNLVIGWNFEFDFWFNFKMFAMPVILIVFLVLQMVYLFKNGTMIEKESKSEEINTADNANVTTVELDKTQTLKNEIEQADQNGNAYQKSTEKNKISTPKIEE